MPAPSPPPSRVRTVVIIVIALFVVATMVAPVAFAHAQLLGSDPADGASLPTTEQLVLTFNEDINPDFVQLVITGPDGEIAPDQAVVEGAIVTQPMTPTSSGAYSVAYRVVSADGHPVSGLIGFTLTDVPARAEAAEPTPEPLTTPEPVTARSGDETATVVADETRAEESGMALSPLALLAGGAVLAGLAGAGAWLARRRRHPEH